MKHFSEKGRSGVPPPRGGGSLEGVTKLVRIYLANLAKEGGGCPNLKKKSDPGECTSWYHPLGCSTR